jgi:DNA-binding response OmpR family regulator
VTEGAAGVDTRVYFGQLSVLVIEGNELESEILSQVLGSFKVRTISRFATTSEAQAFLERETCQLVVVGSATRGSDIDEYDFIRWIRRSKVEEVKTASVILLAGHTPQSNILRARDCGASFVIAKPITPRVLYDRVKWLARDMRSFVEGEAYAGPDRRFQMLGPPSGTAGRRKSDLSLQLGEAKEANLSQSEIDAMMSGKAMARL